MTRKKSNLKPASGNTPVTEQTAKKMSTFGQISSTTFSQCCSWKDDMIKFYRDESITAWKCFLAASLERYLFRLSLHSAGKDLIREWEALQIFTTHGLAPEDLAYLRNVMEEEKSHACSELIENESRAGKKFVSAMQRLDAGYPINGLPAIDPHADLPHFYALIEEGKVPMPDNTAEGDDLNLSFASSTYSEDSAFLSARSTFAEASPRERGLMRNVSTTPRRPVDRTKVKGSHEESGDNMEDGEAKRHPEGVNKVSDGFKHGEDADSSWDKVSPKEKRVSTDAVHNLTGKPEFENKIGGNGMNGGHKIPHGFVPPSSDSNQDSSNARGDLKETKTTKLPPQDALPPTPVQQSQKKKKKKRKSGVKVNDESKSNPVGVVVDPSPSISKLSGQTDDKASKNVVLDVASSSNKLDNQPSSELTRDAAKAPSKKQSAGSDTSAKTREEDDRDNQIEDDERFARELSSLWDKKDVNKEAEDPSQVEWTRVKRSSVSSAAGVFSVSSAAGAPSVFSAAGAASKHTTSSPVSLHNGFTQHPSVVQPRAAPYKKIPELHKTSLCWNYEREGFCIYGANCKHAHGKEELRPFPDWFIKVPQQKLNVEHTEPCNNQQCPARLAFYLRKTSMCVHWEARKCKNTKAECKFAHGKGDLKPLPKYEICQRHLRGRCTAHANECVYAHSPVELRVDKSLPNRPRLLLPPPPQPALNGLDDVQQEVDMSEECSICFEEFNTARRRVPLDCGHNIFCRKCLERWITQDKTCPICRAEVNLSNTLNYPPRPEAMDYRAFAL